MSETELLEAVREYAYDTFETDDPPISGYTFEDNAEARAKLLEAIREWADGEWMRAPLTAEELQAVAAAEAPAIMRDVELLRAKAAVCDAYVAWTSSPGEQREEMAEALWQAKKALRKLQEQSP